MLGFAKERINSLYRIPVSKLIPNRDQPRKNIDMYELSQLAESIRLNGIIQPLTVRAEESGFYELIAGERRFQAAILAGLTTVPCIVVDTDRKKSALMAIVENLQRKDLSMFEEAEAIARLIDCCGLSQLEASEQLGIAQSTLSNKLRILKLNDDQRKRALDTGLSERHIRAVIRIIDDAEREKALNNIIIKQMNAVSAEIYVESILNPKSPSKPQRITATPYFCDMRILQNTLARTVESINKAGFNARSEKSETEEYFQFIIKIPKQFRPN